MLAAVYRLRAKAVHAACVAAVLAGAIPPAEAVEVFAPARSEFRARTAGSPVASVVGRWADGTLTVCGGHAYGTRTEYAALWRSPPVATDGPWDFQTTHQVFAAAPVPQVVQFTESFRVRRIPGRWSPWTSLTKEVGTREGYTEGSFGGSGRVRDRLQVEWRLEGELVGTVGLCGTFDVDLAGG